MDHGELRRSRRRAVERFAATQDGVVSRRQVYAAGVTRAEVRANVLAGRWRRVGSQSLSVRTGPLTLEARHRAAVFEAGPRAYLDAWSSLLAHGLQRMHSDTIRVSVPRGVRRRRGRGLDVRQTRRFDPDDVVEDAGVPRSSVEVAAVRAALWARSDRQAALFLTMAVQQGLTTPERIGRAMLAVRRDRRRGFVHGVLHDLLGGAGSLGELDVVRGCRRRGLPAPTSQAVRRSARGTYYLDLRWDAWRVVVEVDGIQHLWVEQVVGDAIRHNAIALSGDTVLRSPVLGLRVAPDDFYAQIEHALMAAGWQRAA